MANGNENSGVGGNVPLGRQSQGGRGNNGVRPDAVTDRRGQGSQGGGEDQDFERRKEGFKNVFNRLTQTPQGRMALLQAGASLASGENLGQAVARGANNFVRSQQQEQENRIAQQKAASQAALNQSKAVENFASAESSRAQAGKREAKTKQIGAETVETLQSIRQGNTPDPTKLIKAKAEIFQKNLKLLTENAALTGDLSRQQILSLAEERTNANFENATGGRRDPFQGFIPRLNEQGDLTIVNKDGQDMVVLDPVRAENEKQLVPLESFREGVRGQGQGQQSSNQGQ